MSNIKKAFENGKAFIPFITCGDPDLDTTFKIVKSAADNGADLIELGIPFSDPTAEGPVIQKANLRALTSGTTTDKIFDLVRNLRKEVTVPFVFMTYANVVFSYGAERFIKTAKEAGVDGIILPDIPYEEKEEFSDVCEKYDFDLISMLAPTSENRVRMIAKEANAPIPNGILTISCTPLNKYVSAVENTGPININVINAVESVVISGTKNKSSISGTILCNFFSI